MMIDDYAKAMDLVRKMEANLPIPARPTGGFIRAMKAQGIKIARDQELPISRVFYMGDEAGISCDVTPPGMEKTPIICSLTHLRIRPGHPLAKEIRAYQRERKRRLAQAGGSREPTSFTVKPRKKDKR
jgi:hypothetical protein